MNLLRKKGLFKDEKIISAAVYEKVLPGTSF
jgi:hypothetical protein